MAVISKLAKGLFDLLDMGKKSGEVVNYPDEWIEQVPYELRKEVARHNEGILGTGYRNSFNEIPTVYRGSTTDTPTLRPAANEYTNIPAISTTPEKGAANVYATEQNGNVSALKIRGDVDDYPDYFDAESDTAYKLGIDEEDVTDLMGKELDAFNSQLMGDIKGRGGRGLFYGLEVPEYAVFDPKDLRSVNAVFDPAKASSSNLLASNPAAGATAAGMGLLAMGASDDSEAGVVGSVAKGVLDMATSARMSRADDMGFDTDLYHKTWSDTFEETGFDGFDPAKMQGSDYGYAGKGVYTTPEPLGGTTYGNVTMPLKTNIKNPYIMTKENFQDELTPYQWIPANADNYGGLSQASSAWTKMMQDKGYDGFVDKASKNGEVVVFEPSNLRSKFAQFDPSKAGSGSLSASKPAATIGAGILGAIGASQSGKTYADYSPSNLARLQNDDVGGYQAPFSGLLARAAMGANSLNDRGVDDPLMQFVAPRLPSELMGKIAYNDKRGASDYLKAAAGLLGLY